MKPAELKEQWFALGFRLKLCGHYHLERRRFFERWNRIATFLSVVLGSGTALALVGNGENKQLALWLAFAVTVVSAGNLVIGFARHAWEHAHLFGRFIDLENAWRRTPQSEAAYLDLMERKGELDKAEPTPMPYLITRCQIDVMRREGYKEAEWPSLNWFQRTFAHYLPEMG